MIPNFTADASLFKSTLNYRSQSKGILSDSSTNLRQQMLNECKRRYGDNCHPMDGYCMCDYPL